MHSAFRTDVTRGGCRQIFPTLVELAGLPSVPSSEGLEGTSLAPVLQDPQDAAGVKAFAYSQYPRCPQYDILTDSIRCESRLLLLLARRGVLMLRWLQGSAC